MATLITKIDQNTGNYETTFLYTLYASFSGIEERIDDARIRLFLPDWLGETVGAIPDSVKSVTLEQGDGGKTLVFDLGEIQDMGVSVSFGFGLQFQIGTPTGTQFEARPQLWINGEMAQEEESDPITLAVLPNFIVTQQRILPLDDPAADSTVYHQVTLENQGDLGGLVENFSITCTVGEGLIIDPSYPVLGREMGVGDFADDSQDGRSGVVSENGLRFTLEQFQGVRYVFVYRTLVASTVEIGAELSITLSWAGADIPTQSQSGVMAIGGQSFDGTLSLYGPKYSMPDAPIVYELNVENRGNQMLQDVALKQEIPSEMSATTLVTGVFHIDALDEVVEEAYEIFYTTGSGATGSLGRYSTSTAQRISLEGVGGDGIAFLTLTLPQLGVGVSTKSGFYLDGTVRGETPLATKITKSDSMDWGGGGGTAEKTTEISDTCSLLPLSAVSPSGQYAAIGESLRYTIGASCYQSRLKNPILAALLPKELSYLGNASLQLSGYFDQPTPDIPVAKVQSVDGQTLVQFAFTGENSFEFFQRSNIKISFDGLVKIGALGDFDVIPLLQTADSQSYSPSSVSQLMVDGISYGTRRSQRKTVLFFAALTCQKQVKGDLDGGFVTSPNLGLSLEGGTVEYRLRVTNSGNAVFDTVELVDILPHLGDRGVIVTGRSRGSEFPLYLSGEVGVLVEGETAQSQVSYATSYDPLRFGGRFDEIGQEDSWKSWIPSEGVGAVKVAIQTPLSPGETLVVGLRTTVPVGVQPQQIAWNSFATQATYTNPQGVKTTLLAVEGEQVGVQISATPAGTGRIEGQVLLEGEGLNDVGVVLYDESGHISTVTFTAPNMEGKTGQYLFANLPFGTYGLGFVVDGRYHTVVAPEGIQTISLSDFHRLDGVVALRNPIDDLLMVNHSARQMVRNVVRNQMLIGTKLEDIITAPFG